MDQLNTYIDNKKKYEIIQNVSYDLLFEDWKNNSPPTIQITSINRTQIKEEIWTSYINKINNIYIDYKRNMHNIQINDETNRLSYFVSKFATIENLITEYVNEINRNGSYIESIYIGAQEIGYTPFVFSQLQNISIHQCLEAISIPTNSNLELYITWKKKKILIDLRLIPKNLEINTYYDEIFLHSDIKDIISDLFLKLKCDLNADGYVFVNSLKELIENFYFVDEQKVYLVEKEKIVQCNIVDQNGYYIDTFWHESASIDNLNIYKSEREVFLNESYIVNSNSTTLEETDLISRENNTVTLFRMEDNFIKTICIRYIKDKNVLGPLKISAYRSCTLGAIVQYSFKLSEENWGNQPRRACLYEISEEKESIIIETNDISDIGDLQDVFIFSLE